MNLRDIEQQLIDNNIHVKQGYDQSNAIVKAGSLLRQLRKYKGLTQRQLGAICRVQQAEISRIEKGGASRGMTLSQLKTIAEAQDTEIVIAIIQKNNNKETIDTVKIEGRTVLMHTVI